MQFDLADIEDQMALGQSFKIKYRYPLDTGTNRERFAVRSDRLMDVSREFSRFYTLYRGVTPIWLEAEEIIEMSPDDGVYEDFEDE